MKLPRRAFLHLAAGAAALPANQQERLEQDDVIQEGFSDCASRVVPVKSLFLPKGAP